MIATAAVAQSIDRVQLKDVYFADASEEELELACYILGRPIEKGITVFVGDDARMIAANWNNFTREMAREILTEGPAF